MILNICMKFQEDIFNGFHVKHRHDFVTELLLTSSKGNIAAQKRKVNYGEVKDIRLS